MNGRNGNAALRYLVIVSAMLSNIQQQQAHKKKKKKRSKTKIDHSKRLNR